MGSDRSLPCYDAHNHFQDERLAAYRDQAVRQLATLGEFRLEKMVVNGTRESDWPAVLEAAEKYPFVIPSVGLHPWYIRARSADWKEKLIRALEQRPCAVGEIGLDHWMKDYDANDQEAVFIQQLEIAAARHLPASVHCLKAFGRLWEILRDHPRPADGFLLHSYGGSAEMVDWFVKLGAYFSLSGWLAHPRKEKQRQVFRAIPRDRLLIETDAPDMLPPVERIAFPLETGGERLNNPANIAAVYQFASELFEQPPEALAKQVETNFRRLFARVLN